MEGYAAGSAEWKMVNDGLEGREELVERFGALTQYVHWQSEEGDLTS